MKHITTFITLFVILFVHSNVIIAQRKHQMHTMSCQACTTINPSNDLIKYLEYKDAANGKGIIKLPFSFKRGQGFASKNGLFKMIFNEHWQIYSKCRLALGNNNGSIWNPLNGKIDLFPIDRLELTQDGGMKVYNDKNKIIWQVESKNKSCNQYYLELTDYGNLQIVSGCGTILWESRSDSNPKELIGSEYGYYVSPYCEEKYNDNYHANTFGAVNGIECPSCISHGCCHCPQNPIYEKGTIILKDCRHSTFCMTNLVPIDDICKYVENCGLCDMASLCAGEIIFDIDQHFSALLIRLDEDKEQFILSKSKKSNGKSILKIPHSINKNDYYLQFSFDQKINDKRIGMSYQKL